MKVEVDIESADKAVTKYLRRAYDTFHAESVDSETDKYLKALKVVLKWHMMPTKYEKWSKKYDG